MKQNTIVCIDLAVLATNHKVLNAHLGITGPTADSTMSPLTAVLKCDAYSHGTFRAAQCLAAGGINEFGITSIEDGIGVRKALPPHVRLTLISPCLRDRDSAEAMVEHGITSFVGNKQWAALLHAAAQRQNRCVPYYLEVDLGMGRSGFLPKAALGTAETITQKLPRLSLAALVAHFPDPADRLRTLQQLQIVRELQAHIAHRGSYVPLQVGASSAAILVPETRSDTNMRIGRLIFGIVPPEVATAAAGLAARLHPGISLRSCVVEVESRNNIGYGTHSVPRGTRVAVIPVGAGDGYPSRMSYQDRRGSVLLSGGRRAAILAVHMNVTLIDVTHCPDVRVGDEVVLIGASSNATTNIATASSGSDPKPEEYISLSNAAEIKGVSMTELVAALAHIPRTYVT